MVALKVLRLRKAVEVNCSAPVNIGDENFDLEAVVA